MPARQAYSHSVSLGNLIDLPVFCEAFWQNSLTSPHETPTTGWFSPWNLISYCSDGFVPITACHWALVTEYFPIQNSRKVASWTGCSSVRSLLPIMNLPAGIRTRSRVAPLPRFSRIYCAFLFLRSSSTFVLVPSPRKPLLPLTKRTLKDSNSNSLWAGLLCRLSLSSSSCWRFKRSSSSDCFLNCSNRDSRSFSCFCLSASATCCSLNCSALATSFCWSANWRSYSACLGAMIRALTTLISSSRSPRYCS